MRPSGQPKLLPLQSPQAKQALARQLPGLDMLLVSALHLPSGAQKS